MVVGVDHVEFCEDAADTGHADGQRFAVETQRLAPLVQEHGRSSIGRSSAQGTSRIFAWSISGGPNASASLRVSGSSRSRICGRLVR